MKNIFDSEIFHFYYSFLMISAQKDHILHTRLNLLVRFSFKCQLPHGW